MTDTAPLILVVDDDEGICWAVEQILKAEGWRVALAADAAAARRAVKRQRPDLVLSDVRMPGESGLDLLAWLHGELPGVPVIVTTAHGTLDVAAQAVARGAADYLPKPLDRGRLTACIRRLLGETLLAAAARPGTGTTDELSGRSPLIQEVYRRIATAASGSSGVLVTGATGTGKELVARALHRLGGRSDQPFIILSCGVLAEQRAAEELQLAVQAAGPGTLFLDGIAELPRQGQAALSALLESGTALRCRIVAATSRDLAALSAAGAFRDDLHWRLKVVAIALPTLAQRIEDLDDLVRALLLRTAARLIRPLAITDQAVARLRAHSWPGNVRELAHVLEEAAVLAVGGTIDSEHLVSLPGANADLPLAPALAALAARMLDAFPGEAHQHFTDVVEEALLRAALAKTSGNQLRAAELLGINRTTLKKRMDQFGT